VAALAAATGPKGGAIKSLYEGACVGIESYFSGSGFKAAVQAGTIKIATGAIADVLIPAKAGNLPKDLQFMLSGVVGNLVDKLGGAAAVLKGKLEAIDRNPTLSVQQQSAQKKAAIAEEFKKAGAQYLGEFVISGKALAFGLGDEAAAAINELVSQIIDDAVGKATEGAQRKV
jgi:hypothetical protein